MENQNHALFLKVMMCQYIKLLTARGVPRMVA